MRPWGGGFELWNSRWAKCQEAMLVNINNTFFFQTDQCQEWGRVEVDADRSYIPQFKKRVIGTVYQLLGLCLVWKAGMLWIQHNELVSQWVSDQYRPRAARAAKNKNPISVFLGPQIMKKKCDHCLTIIYIHFENNRNCFWSPKNKKSDLYGNMPYKHTVISGSSSARCIGGWTGSDGEPI